MIPAFAQFETSAIMPGVDGSFGIASGDFNGDGILDVAVIGGGSLKILLGNGDGSFRKAVTYTGDLTVGLSIVAADFNHDGILDLAIAYGSVNILLGRGDGTFAKPAAVALNGSSSYLAVADFNNDGKPDIAVIDSPYISVLLGNGDGTFQPPLDNDSYLGAHQLAVGDFNNDGKFDLLADGYLGSSGTFGILLGNGDGSLQPAIKTDLAVLPQSSAVVGDFDGDGNLDFAIPQQGVALFFGNGDGSFQREIDEFPGVWPADAIDINGDGILDLIGGSGGLTKNGPLGGINVLIGNGDGTFQSPQFYNQRLAGALVIRDFNGDGKVDLVFANNFDVTTMLNTAPLRFYPATPVHFPTQLVNSVSATQSVSLINTGKEPILVNSLQASEGFTSSTTCGPSIAPGVRCSINVQSKPESAGFLHGVVNLNDSASTKPQFIVLTGASTGIQLSPPTLNFGDQKVGTTSPPQLMTVINLSDSALTFDFISIVGTDRTNFPIFANTCGVQIEAGASCAVTIRFTPSKKGSRNAEGHVTMTGSPNPVRWTNLVGNGT